MLNDFDALTPAQQAFVQRIFPAANYAAYRYNVVGEQVVAILDRPAPIAAAIPVITASQVDAPAPARSNPVSPTPTLPRRPTPARGTPLTPLRLF